MKLLLKVLDGRKVIKRRQTTSPKVFAQLLASTYKQLKGKKFNIRVDYENEFFNEGEYTEKGEMMKAFRAFIEK